MQHLFDLKGKRALITGSTQGLGMAIAMGLSKAGADIIINGRTSEKLQIAIKKFQKNGISVSAYPFDITNDAEVEHMIDLIENEIGPINILVNNAGVINRVPMQNMKTKDFRAVIDVNLIGPFIVSKYVGRKMINRKEGKIININSLMSELGRESVSAYAASKGGLKMLTKNMAAEWGKFNIQTNGIGPGYMATSLTKPLQNKSHSFNKFIINRTPAARWGNPEDLIGASIFLASKASDFVNGQIIYVDGGILATVGKPEDEF